MAHNPIQEQLLSRGLVDPGNVGVFGSPISPIDVAEIERVTEALPPADELLFPEQAGITPGDIDWTPRVGTGEAFPPVATERFAETEALSKLRAADFAGPADVAPPEAQPPTEPTRRAAAGYVAKTGEAFEAQQEAARAREEFEVTEAADVAGAAQGRIEYLEGERLQAMERAEEARAMKAEAEEKLQREVDFAAVNVDRGTYDEWTKRLEDPGVADEEKAEIQRKIQKAKEIDPTAYLGKTMGQKVVVGILMAVAQAFGAYGAALGRTPNYAAQIIKSAIDRSIAGQRALFAKKQKALGVRRQIYGRMLDAYDGDEDKADAAAKAASYEMVKQRIAQISAKTASAEAQVSAQEMIARIEAEKIKEMHRIHDIDRRRALERVKAKTAAATASGLTIPGWGGAALTKAEYGKAVKYMQNVTKATKGIEDLIAMREDPLLYVPGAPIRERALSVQRGLILSLRNKEAMGANFTIHERELVESMTAKKPWELGWVTDRLNQTLGDLTNSSVLDMELWGFTPSGQKESNPYGFEEGR